MEREEGEDMIFLLVWWVGVGENISSLPVCVRDVNRRRVESSQAWLSGCLVGKSKASPSKLKTKDKARYSFHLTTDITIRHTRTHIYIKKTSPTRTNPAKQLPPLHSPRIHKRLPTSLGRSHPVV